MKKLILRLKRKYHIDIYGFYKVNDSVEWIVSDIEKELVNGYYVQDVFNYLDYLKSSNREKDQKKIPMVLEYINSISKQNILKK